MKNVYCISVIIIEGSRKARMLVEIERLLLLLFSYLFFRNEFESHNRPPSVFFYINKNCIFLFVENSLILIRHFFLHFLV